MPELTSAQAESIIKESAESFPHDACLTCECFLGLVSQLSIDTEPAGRTVLEAYKVPRKEMHACLGCDPCPPGDRYAGYMRQKQSRKLITL
jgi:hypothetical protein